MGFLHSIPENPSYLLAKCPIRFGHLASEDVYPYTSSIYLIRWRPELFWLDWRLDVVHKYQKVTQSRVNR